MARKIDLSGTQVFVAMVAGLCLAGPLAWMFVKYWLFAL
jgi:hypothetical protein